VLPLLSVVARVVPPGPNASELTPLLLGSVGVAVIFLVVMFHRHAVRLSAAPYRFGHCRLGVCGDCWLRAGDTGRIGAASGLAPICIWPGHASVGSMVEFRAGQGRPEGGI